MKKLLITAAATLVCVGAFAQGKVLFVNDTLHLVYFTTDAGKVITGDAPGAPTSIAGTAGGVVNPQALAADLWYGATSDNLSRVATTTFAGNAATSGEWASTLVTTLPSASKFWFQVQVYGAVSGVTSYAQASTNALVYYGESAIFQVTAGSFSPNPIWSQTVGNWPNGTFPVSGPGDPAGSMGAIAIQANVPEPTTIALAGLGVASLLIFRRRK